MPMPTACLARGRSVNESLFGLKVSFYQLSSEAKPFLKQIIICSTEILKRIQSSRDIKTIVTEVN